MPSTNMDRDNRDRLAALLALCPWIERGNGRSLLYVGAMPTRADFLEFIVRWGWKVDVLEVWEPYLPAIRQIPGVSAVHLGDVRTWQPAGRYDVVFWWHGLEHIEAADAPQALKRLEAYAGLAVILGMPRGHTDSGNTGGNDYNRHRSSWTLEDLLRLGYHCLETKGQTWNLTACKLT